jgi:predicted PurR-regulated permease PerM
VIKDSMGQDNFKKSAMTVFASMQKLSSSTFELSLVIIFFFLLLWKRHSITNFLGELNPLPHKIMYQITNEVTSTLQIVFCTLLVLAIAQGLAFAGLMLFYNYNATILGFAAGVCSMIPVFGTALVWVPVAINEFATGHVIGAVIIVIFGWLVMAVIIDNFLRIILLKNIARHLQLKQPINEFLLFFSIAGGLSTVGFWGIILGPAMVTLFLALSHIYISLKKPQSQDESVWQANI